MFPTVKSLIILPLLIISFNGCNNKGNEVHLDAIRSIAGDPKATIIKIKPPIKDLSFNNSHRLNYESRIISGTDASLKFLDNKANIKLSRVVDISYDLLPEEDGYYKLDVSNLADLQGLFDADVSMTVKDRPFSGDPTRLKFSNNSISKYINGPQTPWSCILNYGITGLSILFPTFKADMKQGQRWTDKVATDYYCMSQSSHKHKFVERSISFIGFYKVNGKDFALFESRIPNPRPNDYKKWDYSAFHLFDIEKDVIAGSIVKMTARGGGEAILSESSGESSTVIFNSLAYLDEKPYFKPLDYLPGDDFLRIESVNKIFRRLINKKSESPFMDELSQKCKGKGTNVFLKKIQSAYNNTATTYKIDTDIIDLPDKRRYIYYPVKVYNKEHKLIQGAMIQLSRNGTVKNLELVDQEGDFFAFDGNSCYIGTACGYYNNGHVYSSYECPEDKSCYPIESEKGVILNIDWSQQNAVLEDRTHWVEYKLVDHDGLSFPFGIFFMILPDNVLVLTKTNANGIIRINGSPPGNLAPTSYDDFSQIVAHPMEYALEKLWLKKCKFSPRHKN